MIIPDTAGFIILRMLKRVTKDFIENVIFVVPTNENGEFNQSVVELHGRQLCTNSCFTNGVIVDGRKNNRVEEFLFPNTKKGFNQWRKR